ncbi:histidine utilization repressor [Agrobacterium sp. rho-13.3]|uniref:histidine utilization repressor n=1 Tax=Agrobacterium sp. rho-13.3 TaxID=3072980 RepID=UPI002A1803C9|nr:histidine utilization repressor [Agrobacterium sp. rho-13.3]MDX8309791.1 histidine utilization repressor [Agrobacterium sp. rho-13.3]
MAEAPRVQEKSLHERITSEVEGRILSGEWPPGHRIPFEYELTEEYSCSRMTVNKALGELVKKGLIERRRRSGSFVTQPHAQSAVLEIHDIQREVQALGLTYAYRLDSREVRKSTAEDRVMLEVKAGAQVLALTCRHFTGDVPFCLEERVINVSSVPEARDADFSIVGPGSWLLKMVPWSAAEHRIRAVSADRRVAESLAIPTGTACLVIERRTWNGQTYITHVKVTYPGDRHELVAQFLPSQQT